MVIYREHAIFASRRFRKKADERVLMRTNFSSLSINYSVRLINLLAYPYKWVS